MIGFYNEDFMHHISILQEEKGVYRFVTPFVGLLEVYTFFDSCCGGCDQEIKITDLVNNKKLLDIDSENYNFLSGECPADNPYKYLKEKKIEEIEVFDTPMIAYIVALRELPFEYDCRCKYVKKIETLALTLDSHNGEYVEYEPIIVYLSWEETEKVKTVPIEKMPVFGEDYFVYT